VDKFEQFLIVAPVLLFSMVAHEYAHGYAALKQGDTTAYQLGRLTWNPAKHIDPFMTIILPLMTFFIGGFVFGGAKPVPVNPRNYRKIKRGDIIVSLAGVATNLVLAGLFTGLIALFGLLGRSVPMAAETLSILQTMLLTGVFFNLVLVFFNLIPIPPLDGSHVVKYLLPPAWSLRYQRVGMYGMLILIALLTVGRPVLVAWLSPMFAIFGSAQRMVAPYLIPSQFLSTL
jgi:Zn-dependent protease